MAEYIELIDKYRITQNKDTDYNPPSYEWVDNTGEIVRCKDCKYYCKDADGYEMCDNSEGYDHVTADGFCAWAVKREES